MTFTRAFVIQSALSPSQVLARLSPIVSKAESVGGWMQFWLTWDGTNKKIKFAGQLDENGFDIRRVHGVRFVSYVSVNARGRVTSTPSGTHIAVDVSPSFEEFGYLLLLIPIAAWTFWPAAGIRDLAIVFAVLVAWPIGFFLFSYSRESDETERLLRARLSPDQ